MYTHARINRKKKRLKKRDSYDVACYINLAQLNIFVYTLVTVSLYNLTLYISHLCPSVFEILVSVDRYL